MEGTDLECAIAKTINRTNRLHRRLMKLEDHYYSLRWFDYYADDVLHAIHERQVLLLKLVQRLFCLMWRQGATMCPGAVLHDALMARYSGRVMAL